MIFQTTRIVKVLRVAPYNNSFRFFSTNGLDFITFLLFSSILWYLFFFLNLNTFFINKFTKLASVSLILVNLAANFLAEVGFILSSLASMFLNSTVQFFFLIDSSNLALLSNPNIDLDLSTNTDTEDLLAYLGDAIEFTEQDKSLLIDSIFDTWAGAEGFSLSVFSEAFVLSLVMRRVLSSTLAKIFK